MSSASIVMARVWPTARSERSTSTESPSAMSAPSTRSAWQRCPSWLVKLDATEKDGDARVYRLTQCERNAGMLNVFTDAFLRHGNGNYRLSFEARARCGDPVPFEAFTIPNDDAWHRFDISLATDFDMGVTELAALFLKAASLPADEVCFKNLSLTKEPK